MKKILHQIVDNNTTKEGKIFDYFIQTLILLSLVAYSLETLPNNSVEFTKVLNTFELICAVFFSIEYLLRIYVTNKPIKYIFSFYGIIDLLAILPFYLNNILDLRYIRAFRIFRIFRAIKLIRYSKAIDRYKIAIYIIKEELVLFLLVTGILIFIAGSGIYYFENRAQPEVFASIFHSLWWAIVTITTVGYGDVYPITVGGKIFTFFVLLVGIGVITVPAGLVSTALTRARELEERKRRIESKYYKNR